MPLASWIRFETATTSDDWEGAISLLVSNLHRPDKELPYAAAKLCGRTANCLHGRSADFVAEKLWGRQRQSKCVCPMADGDGARPLSTDPVPGSVCHPSPISSAAYLCRRSNHKTGTMEWSHCKKVGLFVDVTPTATGLQGMHEHRIAFPSWSQMAIFCPAHFQSCNF